MAYELIRTTPEGVEKTQGPFDTVRGAAVAAGRVLHDNGAASRVEAQWFGADFARKPIGEELTHASSGYRFRIERKGEGE